MWKEKLSNILIFHFEFRALNTSEALRKVCSVVFGILVAAIFEPFLQIPGRSSRSTSIFANSSQDLWSPTACHSSRPTVMLFLHGWWPPIAIFVVRSTRTRYHGTLEQPMTSRCPDRILRFFVTENGLKPANAPRCNERVCSVAPMRLYLSAQS